MKRLVFALALALGGCATLPAGLPAPAELANRTVVDEQAAIGANLLYVAASRTGNLLFPSGHPKRPQFQALDRQAYAAVLVVQRAYETGNSADMASGLVNLNGLVKQLQALRN